MKILLINTSSENDILSNTIHKINYLNFKAFFAPHAVATVAALTPKQHEVEIFDEQIHGSVLPVLQKNEYDIVGINLIATQLNRVLEIVRFFRRESIGGKLVIGGTGVSFALPELDQNVDTFFVGEVEDTWPVYLSDLESGYPRKVYQSEERPDITNNPAPRWDLIKDDIPNYSAIPVQTTRGCPFNCDFCDVVHTFGNKPRRKSIEAVLDEVQAVKRLGAQMIFFTDDNFAGNKAYAKELLRKLFVLNNSFDTPAFYGTQLDITICQDDELLELLADCNFFEVQIGIESNNKKALRDLGKTHNIRFDLTKAINKIQSYGILVMAHLIVGADSDDQLSFKNLENFVSEANVIHSLCHPLVAPPGSKLWQRLKEEGRLIAESNSVTDNHTALIGNDIDLTTNIIPKNMTRNELFLGLADFIENASNIEEYIRKTESFIHDSKRKPRVKAPQLKAQLKASRIMKDVIFYHLFRARKGHRKAFFHLLGLFMKDASHMIPKFIFLHTRFVMDCERSTHAAAALRNIARNEEQHEHDIVGLRAESSQPEILKGLRSMA